jgi:hypothetical protein
MQVNTGIDGTQAHPASTDASPVTMRFDSRPVWGIVGTGALLETLDWFWKFEDPTWQVILFWCIPIATAFCGFSWWLIRSPLPLKRRLIVLAGVAAAVGGWFACYRFAGFTGDLSAHFDYRWQKPPEVRAADYWTSQDSRVPIVGGTPDSVADPARNQDDLPITAEDWPQFEGPNRDGIARGVHLRTNWDERPPKELWRHPVGLVLLRRRRQLRLHAGAARPGRRNRLLRRANWEANLGIPRAPPALRKLAGRSRTAGYANRGGFARVRHDGQRHSQLA